MKLAMALFTRSRDAPTIPASSSWVTGSTNSSAPAGQLEDALGGAAGDVEEHRVGQRLVHRRAAGRQHPDHAPQQAGVALEDRRGQARRAPTARVNGSSARASAERGCSSSMAHLAEEVARFHQREDALASVDGAVGDGDAPLDTTNS